MRKLFGLRLSHVMECSACGKRSLENHWHQLCEQVYAFEIREAPLLQVLRSYKEADTRSCDKDEGGCGAMNQLKYALEASTELLLPKLYTVMVSWDTPFPSTEEVASFLTNMALDVEYVTNTCCYFASIHSSCPLFV